MSNLAVKAVVALALPAVAFFAGVWVMQKVSGRQSQKDDPKPLNQRILGYDEDEAKAYWDALAEKKDLAAERLFLELDLVFPFLYGGALAAGLLMVWAALGRTFHPASILAPVAITVLADWTENLVQWGQLRRFTSGMALEAGWIRIASTATTVKLLFFAGSYLLIAGLVVWAFKAHSLPAR